MLDVAGFVHSGLGVMQPHPLKVSVAFKRFDSGPSHKCDARVRFDSGDQVSRHRFSEAWSSHHEINMLGGAVKENCRLSCGIPAAHDRHLFVTADGGLDMGSAIVDSNSF